MRSIERRVRALPGVQAVKAEPLTGSVTVQFLEGTANEKSIIEAATLVRTEAGETPELPDEGPAPRDRHSVSVVHDGVTRRGAKLLRRVRVSVRGLDRDSRVGRRVVERLSQRAGVRAQANPLTGRVLIEFDDDLNELVDLLGDIVEVELPGTAGEDNPTHPLDPAPLNQAIVRTVGAGVGLGILAARRLATVEGPIAEGPIPAYLGGAVSLMQGIPAIKKAVRTVFGRNVGDLALTVPDIALAAVNSSPLSLLVNGTGALRLLMTVTARRQSWQKYEERLGDSPSPEAGCTVSLEAGEVTSMPALVLEGFGTATDLHGMPVHFAPGDTIEAGSKLRGSGPFVLELQDTEPVEALPPNDRHTPTFADKYQDWNPPASLVFAAVLGIATRSAGRAMEAMLCLSPRSAMAGIEAAHLNAVSRVIRGGATVVGTRPHRPIRLPGAMIIESPRIITHGSEITDIALLQPGVDATQALELAAKVSCAAHSPWGDIFRAQRFSGRGHFAHGVAHATLDEIDYVLETTPGDGLTLVLSRVTNRKKVPVSAFATRPRLAAGLSELVEVCKKNDVDLIVLAPNDSPVVAELAGREGVRVIDDFAGNLITRLQEQGQRVAYVSDGAQGVGAFEQCDLAIGITSGHSGRYAARADVLAPDLAVVASIIEAGAIGKQVIRDSVGLGVVSNIVGAALCLMGPTGIVGASRTVHLATLAAYADAAIRFRGGERTRALSDAYTDPRPEQRWGRRSVADVFAELKSSESGLTPQQVSERQELRSLDLPRLESHSAFLRAIGDQLRSPLVGLMSMGAVLTLFVGTPVEFGFVALTIAANVLFGAWQERQVEGASHALVRLTPTSALVVRAGQEQDVPAPELLPGDIILLSAGDRVPADARIVRSESLEVDESSLTGESKPVPKSRDAASEANRIVLEGSDVTVGHGIAVVVAVGRKTRLGSIALAVAQDEDSKTPLNNRLAKLLQQFLPIAGVAGLIVFGSGVLRGREVMAELVFAATLALSAVPEGLPLLAGVAEVAVARRLSGRKALLRRLAAVEALGRVDVACTDKTGTLTQGRLVLALVTTRDRTALLDTVEVPQLSPKLREVVISAALASPHPDASHAAAHQTDVAVLDGAERLGYGEEISELRVEELPFDPTRAFHVSRLGGSIVVKGAPEAVATMCIYERRENGDVYLDDIARESLLLEASQIASRGMRVLMVATGPQSSSLDDPDELTFLGFIGIRDPLKEGVPEAIERCKNAGIRTIILTGDHPETARAIAQEAGLDTESSEVLTGLVISSLSESELDERMKTVTVVARVTPLDKQRIVQSLQRMGHTVAMTGDGVNDAPALRLADVGVAMGLRGTDVARQAADMVLEDDNFATLVEALVEGRGFWQNIRRTLALLLGGILGELGFVAIASAIGMPPALNTRQILAMNLMTFGLPTLAVALQEPEHRNLAGLAREGTIALEKPLRRDVLRRAAATVCPSLGAFALALPGGLVQAQTVAFGTAIGSQLTQTLDSGLVETGLTKSVMGAVATSCGLLVASVLIPGGRTLLSLAIPSFPSLFLIVIGSCSAPLVARTFDVPGRIAAPRRALPAPVAAV